MPIFSGGSSSRRAGALGLVLLGGLVVANPATVEAESARARAKRHNAEARKLFDLGRFEQAARAYERAYEAKPLPVFLFNLAQCHRRIDTLKSQRLALHYFERYLATPAGAVEEETLAPQVEKVRARIAALQREASAPADDGWTDDGADEPGAAARTPPDLSPPGRGPDQDAAGAAAMVQDRPQPAPPDRPIYKKWWFWTAIGAAVVGGVIIAVAANQSDDWVPGGSQVRWEELN